MPRGSATRVGREMGYTSGEIPRRWRRPQAASDNLFTGELSPTMKASLEIQAHDRAGNSDFADLLAGKICTDLGRQRARRHFDNRELVLLALAEGFHTAIKAFTLDQSRDKREIDLLRAEAAIVRALVFNAGDDGAIDGVPLRLTDDVPHILVRMWRALTSRRRPLLCKFGLHAWETSAHMRRCYRCGLTQPGMNRN